MIRYFFERVRRMERQEFDEIILKNAESFSTIFAWHASPSEMKKLLKQALF